MVQREVSSPMHSKLAKVKGSFSTVLRVYKRGHLVPLHSHGWPQLMYASSGVMAVETPYGSWILPANRAVWLPPACPHETRMLTDVHFNSLYLNPSKRWGQDGCRVLEITPLLRELVLAAGTIDLEQELPRRDQAVMRLIVEELRVSRTETSPVPMPREERLLRLCRTVIENPSLQVTFDHLASENGGSTKTFSRLFSRQLGMTFRDWRELVQMAHAAAYLSGGESVKATASLLGYTANAFAVMVRRLTGDTPQAFRNELRRPDRRQTKPDS